MGEEYIPTTDRVRDWYADSKAHRTGWDNLEMRAEFDRWLASFERQVRERVAAEIEAAFHTQMRTADESGDRVLALEAEGLLDAARIARGGAAL